MIFDGNMRGGGRKPGRGRGKGRKVIAASPEASEVEEEEPVSDADSEMVPPSQNVPSDSDRNIESESDNVDVDTEASQSIQDSQSQPIPATQSQPTTQAKGKETRKKRPPVTITQAQEEAALEFLKIHTVLYDRSKKEYKDTAKRDTLWQKLADRLDTKANPITKVDIKKWFESQRTVYGKCTRLQSGQAAPTLSDRKQWVVTQFSFLSGHIARQPSRATTLKQSQSQSQSLAAQSQQADVEWDSSYAGEVSLTQASRALAHNTRDDAGAGPSGIVTTPVGRPEEISPSTSTTQKRRKVTTPTNQPTCPMQLKDFWLNTQNNREWKQNSEPVC